jgi:threonyl-tRNA synthetase editing subunit
MKILAFQATHFRWKTFSKTLEDADPGEVDDGVEDAVVAFVHLESRDEPEARRKTVFTHTLKHLKWLANKRSMKHVVLHSFTHLGEDNASPAFARAFLVELAGRLESTGYVVKRTPFGWFCSWELGVYGDSLAKVWKET